MSHNDASSNPGQRLSPNTGFRTHSDRVGVIRNPVREWVQTWLADLDMRWFDVVGMEALGAATVIDADVDVFAESPTSQRTPVAEGHTATVA